MKNYNVLVGEVKTDPDHSLTENDINIGHFLNKVNIS